MRRAMTIGRLATAAGVNVETIRYYISDADCSTSPISRSKATGIIPRTW